MDNNFISLFDERSTQGFFKKTETEKEKYFSTRLNGRVFLNGVKKRRNKNKPIVFKYNTVLTASWSSPTFKAGPNSGENQMLWPLSPYLPPYLNKLISLASKVVIREGLSVQSRLEFSAAYPYGGHLSSYVSYLDSGQRFGSLLLQDKAVHILQTHSMQSSLSRCLSLAHTIFPKLRYESSIY